MTPTYDGPLAGIRTDEETVRALDRAHVFHSWSAQALIDPLPIRSASGSRFTDYAGRYVVHCHNLEHEDMAMMANVVTR